MVLPRWVFPRPVGWLLIRPRRRNCQDGARFRYPCRVQCDSRQKVDSQPERSIPRRLTTDTETPLRHSTGITTVPWMIRSFILMKSAARLTGSSSVSAAEYARSYSSLRQRVTLRPCHLLAFDATSHETNWFMKYCGSGAFGPFVYIWRSE